MAAVRRPASPIRTDRRMIFDMTSPLSSAADRNGPGPYGPVRDQPGPDVGIVAGELFGHGRCLGLEDEDRGVGRVAQSSAHQELATGVGLLRVAQVLGA